MRSIRLAALLAAALASAPAAAQVACPTFSHGAVLTAGQWQACFDSKQNSLGYTPLNVAGGTMIGRLTTVAPSVAASGFTLPPGTAPTSPDNGDLWTTSAGVFARVNGATVGPLVGATSSPEYVVRASVDFNAGNTDTSISVPLPAGFTRYTIQRITISGASASLTTATFGVFPAAAGAGTAIVATGTAGTVSTASENTNNNMQNATIVNQTTLSLTTTPIFFRVQTPQGSAATATVTVQILPLS